jgi:hypothetical protein
MRSSSPFSPRPVVHTLLAVLIVLAAIVLWKAGRTGWDRPAPQTATTSAATPAPEPPSPPAAPRSVAAAPAMKASAAKTFDWFQARPFAVASSSRTHEWTAEDGRTPDAILDLGHNDLEVQRLMDENARIERRQLVYRKEPVFVAVERARAAGEAVRNFTLPALDGKELEVEVTRADVAPSGLSGTFAGRIAGRGQSTVTLAFKQGREAFTVLSPEDGTYLQGHPREPGEIILTSFDPDTYQRLPGGEPISPAK